MKKWIYMYMYNYVIHVQCMCVTKILVTQCGLWCVNPCDQCQKQYLWNRRYMYMYVISTFDTDHRDSQGTMYMYTPYFDDSHQNREYTL